MEIQAKGFLHTITQADMRAIDRSAVVEYLRLSGLTSRTELSQKLNISKQTAMRIIDELIDGGFVILSGKVEAAGVRFGYIVTSKTMPLLDQYIEAGVDVLIGVDPMQWNFQEAKRKLSGKICLWGGVNGQLTVERGSEESVREEVRRAFDVLFPGGGFILSPVDNVRASDAKSTQNVHALIDEWRVLSKE